MERIVNKTQPITQNCLLWIYLVTIVLSLSLDKVDRVCVFGNRANCLLLCHCPGNGSCDSNTGKCNSGTTYCKVDEYFGENNPDNGQYWGGDNCQTGNIATGKNARQIGTYYNPGFKLNATADKAIDGNSSTFSYSRLQSTRDTAWWVLDLAIPHAIQKAFILANNLGNSLIKLENYTLWVGNTSNTFEHKLCGPFPSPLISTSRFGVGLTGWNWNPVTCKQNLVARYVSIRKAAHDTNKQWLPLQEVAVIGYPASSVYLGRCLQYINNNNPNLLNLQCVRCLEGWMEPDCRTKSTNVLATTSTNGDIDDDNEEDDDSTVAFPDNMDNMENENPESLSTAMIIIIVVLGIFALISAIVISVLCIKLRNHQRNVPTSIKQSKTGEIEGNSDYSKKGETGYMDLETGYEPLQREKVYLGINSGDPNPVGYYTTPTNNQNSENQKAHYLQNVNLSNKDQSQNASDGYMVPYSSSEGTYTLPKDDECYDDAESAPVYSTIDDATVK